MYKNHSRYGIDVPTAIFKYLFIVNTAQKAAEI
jgi:hypothetical protein